MANPFPSIEETLKHPAYPSAIWALEPHKKGSCQVAKKRDGPLNIQWEIHGSGPVKILLIMGLAGVKTSWQRQTKYFGHDRGEEYSVLILDNRGIGGSDKPLGRYTTKNMAWDVIEVLDHVGWTAEREVHLTGISLGGMVAQEIAYAIPTRLASLSLLCTTASFEGSPTKSYSEAISRRLAFFIPKSEEVTIYDTGHKIFVEEWLASPDEAVELPSPKTTPRCGPAPGTSDGEYLRFDSNFQRYQAQEVFKRQLPGNFSMQGFFCQLAAAGTHYKSPAQLREMADKVGRERIMIMHGRRDNMIVLANGEKLIQHVEPGLAVVEDMGHAPVMERTTWFNELLKKQLAIWSKLEQ